MGTSNNSMTFEFQSLPKNVAELTALPEIALTTPFQAAALTVAILCNYNDDVQATIDMINYIKGPQPLSAYETQFLKDRLKGKNYIPLSFFAGTSPQNNYVPTQPYTITISSDPYSFVEDGYAKLVIKSSGADSVRPIKLRRKGAEGPWFLWENYLLSDIRQPVAADPWA